MQKNQYGPQATKLSQVDLLSSNRRLSLRRTSAFIASEYSLSSYVKLIIAMDVKIIRGRDSSVDILKGLAIILVVYGHTWPFCRNWIYLFHMAVFLIASGYCYSFQPNSIKELKNYVLKKVLSLYLPFLVCNGAFTLLSNLFLKIGIYSDNPLFLELTKEWPVEQSLFQYIGFLDIAKRLIKIALFIGPTQMGTATWFLTSLFLVLIVHSFITMLVRKLYVNNLHIVNFIILCIMLLLTQLASSYRPNLIYAIKCFPCTYVAFLLGIFIKNVKLEKLYSLLMASLAFALLILFSNSIRIEVSAARISNVIVFLVSSICGWILLKFVSEKLTHIKFLSITLQYIGRHTMPILCLHVLCFKLVSEIYIYAHNKPSILLASFHIIFEANELWKLVYLLIGVLGPLVLYYIYRKIWSLIVYRIESISNLMHRVTS